MKRIALFTLILLLVAGVAYAKESEMKKKAGDYTVEARFDKTQPTTGDNNFTIEIRDAEGRMVTDAKVEVEYYMTEKASGTRKFVEMSYHKSKSKAEVADKEGGYKAKLGFSMNGPWHMAVKITKDGKTSKAEFFTNVK